MARAVEPSPFDDHAVVVPGMKRLPQWRGMLIPHRHYHYLWGRLTGSRNRA